MIRQGFGSLEMSRQSFLAMKDSEHKWLPETNSSSLKIGRAQKRKWVFQPSIFRFSIASQSKKSWPQGMGEWDMWRWPILPCGSHRSGGFVSSTFKWFGLVLSICFLRFSSAGDGWWVGCFFGDVFNFLPQKSMWAPESLDRMLSSYLWPKISDGQIYAKTQPNASTSNTRHESKLNQTWRDVCCSLLLTTDM